MFLRGSSRVQKRERKDIRRIAKISGCAEFEVFPHGTDECENGSHCTKLHYHFDA